MTNDLNTLATALYARIDDTAPRIGQCPQPLGSGSIARCDGWAT